MRLAFLCLAFMVTKIGCAQTQEAIPNLNIRVSFLLVPFTPLVTVEASTFNNFTVQLETNFINTHGVNLKYYTETLMEQSYVFVGMASVQNTLLRADVKATLLPYVRYGYAYRFGASKSWVWDSRFGIGRTINADSNSIYPILKTGIGKTF